MTHLFKRLAQLFATPMRAYLSLSLGALDNDRRHRRVQALATLSDGELATLGLTRGQIARHVYGSLNMG